MKNVLMAMAGFLYALSGNGNEIGYIETFSLAGDRQAALAELVPGTDDYFYFHALHAQNKGDHIKFKEVMDRWLRERNGNILPAARELFNRQALLDYEKNPIKTLDYIKRETGLYFTHARKTGVRVSNAPSVLDSSRISTENLLKKALSTENSMERVEDAGLILAAGQNINEYHRRNLLSRLRRPDYPGLVDLINADMERFSNNFGSHPIHALLTLSQLDDLLQKRPSLRNDSMFVNAYLAKLAPENEVNLETETAAREAYFDRVWAFVQNLDPVHNSLKANVLYNRLRHDQQLGIYDRERFMAYIKLPRNVAYLPKIIRDQLSRPEHLAQLGQSFSLICMPPIHDESPLVRAFLLEFFRDAANTEAFCPYVDDLYLRPLFAESKIVNGIGDPLQYARLLSPDAYKQLKERVDIDFAVTNPQLYGPDDPVKLTAFVKNVPALLVKVYEINTVNYYRETGRPLNLAINLDGLVASSSRRVEYKEGTERRVERTFELPELKGRGVFVVELIGNGKSSRAMVQKGYLTTLQEITPAGHAFTVLDENGKRVTDVSGWLGGREFSPDKEGRILVPFTTSPLTEMLMLRKGNFATLVSFSHQSENYALKAGIYVDREALIRREKALVAIRPVLLLNGRPSSIKLLEEPRLVIRSTDLQGISTEKEFEGLVLREDAENVQEIQVPENAVQLEVTLKAKIQNLSQSKKQDLEERSVFTLNGIEQTQQVQALYCGRTTAGYYVDFRGKNGEIMSGEPLSCFFKHRCFRDEVFAELKTDSKGRVQLGPLTGISFFRISAASGIELHEAPLRGACAYPEALHGQVGEVLRIPLVWDATAPGSEVSLLETRNGHFVKDWQSALASVDGFLELRGLPAGDYSLLLKDEGREIAVRVTQGEVRDGFVLSSRRVLERPRLPALNMTALTSTAVKVEIQLANVTPYTRVHVFATRYLPAYNLFTRFGDPVKPELIQQPWAQTRTFYESGRDIGDEYRYIIDRQQAVKYPGNMLERPGLLLNPWVLRATEAQPERLGVGGAYAGADAAMARASYGGAYGGRASRGYSEGYTGLDFLKQPAVTLLNLVPDKEGRVVVPRNILKGLPNLRIMAVDPTTTVLKCLALEDTPVETRELRLAAGLDPAKSFSEQKRITQLGTADSLTIADVTTASFESCDTLVKAYRLLLTLKGDPTFGEFSFVTQWPTLDAKEKLRLYSKYACHELSFFLYNKDPKFFASVIKPYLKNKKDKTFMDHWLLGNPLEGYLEPLRFARLNAVERVLLGKRLREQEASIIRDTRERVELILPDMEAFNHRFDTAVQSSSLEAGGDSKAAAAIENIRGMEALKIKLPKASFAGTPKDIRSANLERLSVPAPAEPELLAEVNMPVLSKKRAESRRATAESKSADVFADEDAESVFFEKQGGLREASRRFFQKLDKTQEWAENNYYHLPIRQHVASRVMVNAFWRDYATHDTKAPFLSKAFPETATNFTEMMLALAVLDLPFKAAEHDEKVAGLSYTLKPKSPLLLFHREICESPRETLPGGVLVAQQFFRADDRERIENGERFDKLVTEEFLPGVVYGAQVVLTNPTGSRQKLQVLLQIPVGAMPVKNGFYTRGVYIVLEPYSTQTQEYFFYFPTIGDYQHYPVTLARNDKVVGSATPFTFHVVEKLSKIDMTSWAWISQNGTEDEVIAFLSTANLYRLSMDEIAWRMRDVAYFKKVIALLKARHLYANTLWSYGILHNDLPAIREYLKCQPFANQCGLWLVSPLLTLDPVERFDYQHLEYAPLVNPRAHTVGAKRTILNDSFRVQYQRFMKVLSYKPRIESTDALAVAYYMALQDRVAEALDWFSRVDQKAVTEELQYDYMEAYLAFYKGDLATARKVAKKHSVEGVDRWRDRFTQVLSQLDEIDGGVAAKADQEKRDEAQAALAASEPVLELLVEAGRIRLDTRNLKTCTLNFYPMDIELLFSRSPFLQEGAAQFSFIRPMLSRVVEIPANTKDVQVEMPAEFATKNVMVEAVAAGVRKTQAYYANTLKVQMVENYGQVLVTQTKTGKAVPGAYVKVYAKMKDNSVKFFKDGYTDLRGRFDYVSLNTNELEDAQRLAVLVMSDSFGAVVREAPPPKR
jgi:hypothetical protein